MEQICFTLHLGKMMYDKYVGARGDEEEMNPRPSTRS